MLTFFSSVLGKATMWSRLYITWQDQLTT